MGKDPHSFKKLVWAMKRSQQQGMRAPSLNALTDRGVGAATGAGGNNEDVALLLREIRDEFRRNNPASESESIKQQQQYQQQEQQQQKQPHDIYYCFGFEFFDQLVTRL